MQQQQKRPSRWQRWRESPKFPLQFWLVFSLPLWLATLVYLRSHPNAIGLFFLSTGQALTSLYQAAGKKHSTLTQIFLGFGSLSLLIAIFASRFLPERWGMGFLIGGSALLAAAATHALMRSGKKS